MPRLLPAGLLCLLCLLSAACAPAIQAIQDYQAPFLCDANQMMQVRFEAFKAVLEFQGVSIALSQRPAADGFLYTGEGQSLRQRGYDAIWTDAKGVVRHCRDANTLSSKVGTAGH